MPLSLPWEWSADIQRQTALSLARKGHTVRVFMANDGAFWFNQLLRGFRTQHPDADQHLVFYQPVFIFPPSKIESLNRLNYLVALRIFKWWVSFRATFPKVLWLCGLEFYELPDFFVGWKSLYYCSDYFAFEEIPTAASREREEMETKTFQRVDLAFVNSHILHELHKKKRQLLSIVSQGFCISDFHHRDKVPSIKRAGRFLIGYVGGISDRIDWKLVTRLVKEHPEWDFAFYYPSSNGPRNSREFPKIMNRKNVIHGTTRDRRELAALIEQFDIGMIPYGSTRPFNYYCFPMKIYEYFYFGIPVISTKNAELLRFTDLVKVTDSYDAWVEWIRRIETKGWPLGKQREEKRQSRLRGWDRQVGMMLKEIEKTLSR